MSNQWTRQCSQCNTTISYSRKDGLVRAEIENRKCHKCSTKETIPWNKGLSCETSEKMKMLVEAGANTQRGRKRSPDSVKKGLITRKGYKHSPETIDKIRHSNTGKLPSDETRRKMSVSAIKRIQKYQLYNKPNFNPAACDFIDHINYSLGFRFQHALNGGEMWINGFYPDGYDKERNIIFEYDEPWHHSEKQKTYDAWKQQCIISKTSPKMFIRYDHKTNRLYDAMTNIDIPTNISTEI